ncbi:MAG: hypothetical protein QM482_07275 [Sulfurospirillum sp.]
MKKLHRLLLYIFFLSSGSLLANNMPTLFIGTYNETTHGLEKNLVAPNLLSTRDDGWGLSKFTEKILKNDYKDKLGVGKFNIILKDKFDKNYKKITLQSNDVDKKIGFLNINTFENSTTLASGQELVYITLNLTFVQIGEEANRVDLHSNFEVRYTNGITTTGLLGIQPTDNREKKLQEGYKNFYKKALGDLIDAIIADKHSKKVKSFTSDDIYFSIDKIVIGKNSKKLALKVFGDKKSAKEQILIILQEALIKEIRADKRLDDVVLLYPDMLNKRIFKNWKDYLKRINSVFINTSTDNDSEVLIRKLKKTCSYIKSGSSVVYVDGYFIEAIVSELYDKLVKAEDVNSGRYIKSSIASRVVLSIEGKKKIDGMSLPSDIIKKKKMAVGQASFGYNIVNKLSYIQKNKITKTLRKSIEKMAPKLKNLILNIVKQRKKIVDFDYQEFCKEY